MKFLTTCESLGPWVEALTEVILLGLACHNIGGSSLRECVAASPVSRFEGERGGIDVERESTFIKAIVFLSHRFSSRNITFPSHTSSKLYASTVLLDLIT